MYYKELIHLLAMKSELTHKQYNVFHHRMNGKTLKELSEEFNCSAERIRQIENKAFEKMANLIFNRAETAEERNQREKYAVLLEGVDGLSTRTLNALHLNNISSIGGLVKKTKEDILSMEGMGERSLEEIVAMLEKKELKLKSYIV